MNKTVNTRRVNAKLRQGAALKLRSEGKGYRAIASELGYRGPSGAYRAVASALKAIQSEGVSELRALHSLRLSEIVASLWGRVKKGDPQAARAVLSCLEREARLYGLDAPSELRLLDSPQWAKVKAVITRVMARHPGVSEELATELRSEGLDNE